MTDTKQTMREHLRQHGLPEAWAEWVEKFSVSGSGPGGDHFGFGFPVARCRLTVTAADGRELLAYADSPGGPWRCLRPWVPEGLRADGWIDPNPTGADYWKAEAEREASAAAELRGDCRELSAKLAGAVEDRDKARAAMDHWRDRAAAAEKEREEAVADAHLARVVLNDCRRVLTKAENERDDAIAKLEAVRRAAW